MAVGKLSNMKLSTRKLSNSGGSGGNAQTTDVLTGKGFTNDTGEQVGSMPNNGALGTITPVTANQTIPSGYTSGGTVAGDPDLISANIKAGANIFNVAGKTEVVDTTTAAGAMAAQVLSTKEAFVNGAKVTGTIHDRSGVSTGVVSNATSSANGIGDLFLVPPEGYYDGAAGTKVNTWDGNFIAANILSGKTVWGLAGTAVSGARKATGSTTSVISTQTDQYEKISVRGLAFKPVAVSTPDKNSVIVALGAGYEHFYPVEGSTSGITVTTSMGTGVTQFNIYADGFDMIARRWTGAGTISPISWAWEAYG